ncbi:CHASE2 domain-containing protein [Sphingopyxis sp. PET50]|uniref:CHASE2 domain-containing protein n=1 Tax=Sphingopyxis sp. PET50 TaxID=2976533 RepID=UPI0021B04C5F|nr:CHASE2 domain-containing protein [Sphingopyxis sp. PET50]
MPPVVNRMIVSWRTLGLALLLSILVGVSGAGDLPDRLIGSATSRLGDRPVSGDIVIVALDDRTLGQTPGGSFSMTQYAEVVSAIDKVGAKRLFLDFYFDRRESDPDFSRLTQAVRKMGNRAVLAVATKSMPGTDRSRSIFPNPAFGDKAQLASIAWDFEFWQVWNVPITYVADGRKLPSFASLLGGKTSAEPRSFRLDFSYNTNSIPIYGAADLLAGRVGAAQLKGKDVIFAPTASTFQDAHYLPGHDLVPGAYIHLIGGETLKRGNPVDIGWLPALVATMIALFAALLPRFQRWYAPRGARRGRGSGDRQGAARHPARHRVDRCRAVPDRRDQRQCQPQAPPLLRPARKSGVGPAQFRSPALAARVRQRDRHRRQARQFRGSRRLPARRGQPAARRPGRAPPDPRLPRHPAPPRSRRHLRLARPLLSAQPDRRPSRRPRRLVQRPADDRRTARRRRDRLRGQRRV